MADPNQIASGVEQLVESAVPVLAPFHPLIALVTTAVIAHFQATKTWPTEEEVRAALPVDYMKLVNEWATWTPAGDGSLASRPTSSPA